MKLHPKFVILILILLIALTAFSFSYFNTFSFQQNKFKEISISTHKRIIEEKDSIKLETMSDKKISTDFDWLIILEENNFKKIMQSNENSELKELTEKEIGMLLTLKQIKIVNLTSIDNFKKNNCRKWIKIGKNLKDTLKVNYKIEKYEEWNFDKKVSKENIENEANILLNQYKEKLVNEFETDLVNKCYIGTKINYFNNSSLE